MPYQEPDQAALEPMPQLSEPSPATPQGRAGSSSAKVLTNRVVTLDSGGQWTGLSTQMIRLFYMAT